MLEKNFCSKIIFDDSLEQTSPRVFAGKYSGSTTFSGIKKYTTNPMIKRQITQQRHRMSDLLQGLVSLVSSFYFSMSFKLMITMLSYEALFTVA